MDIDILILKLFNGSSSQFLDTLAVTLTNGLVWIPLYIFLSILVIKNNKTLPQILLAFGCGILGVLLSGVLSDLVVKPWVARPRPCNDPELKYLVQTVVGYHANGYSFFSSHAANTFSLAMFFTLLVRSRLLNITLFSWAFLNAWTRIYLGVHWFTDVLTGLTWGLITGCLMYLLYYKVFYAISPHTKYVSTQYTSTGYSFADIHMCVAIIVFTIAFSIVRSVIIF